LIDRALKLHEALAIRYTVITTLQTSSSGTIGTRQQCLQSSSRQYLATLLESQRKLPYKHKVLYLQLVEDAFVTHHPA
jgi:hypothetical protein